MSHYVLLEPRKTRIDIDMYEKAWQSLIHKVALKSEIVKLDFEPRSSVFSFERWNEAIARRKDKQTPLQQHPLEIEDSIDGLEMERAVASFVRTSQLGRFSMRKQMQGDHI